MAIQRHPVESFDTKINFWEEFPDYKIHPVLGRIWKTNRKDKLKESSLFMWALALCYDRKSSIFPQPEQDKWEAASEQLFGDEKALLNFALYDSSDEDDPFAEADPIIGIPSDLDFRLIINEFERSIDTPLGIALRDLERKLMERTAFIMDTPYTIDSVQDKDGKRIITKGTADQLDKMFANTEKINTLITKAMDNLRSAEGQGITKGGQEESLGDKAEDF